MDSKERQKMCASCDGRIPFSADICPYCAADQATPDAHTPKKPHHQSLQDSLIALYTPPYAVNKAETHKPEPLKEPMAQKRFQSPSASLGAPTIPMDAQEEQRAQDERSSFWPILILSIAGNLFTIGLLQLFFSDNGFLRLEWDSSYWFFYCAAAIPLFFFGFKKANLL